MATTETTPPDFVSLAQSMETVFREGPNIAQQISNFRNFPQMDNSARILASLERLERDVRAVRVDLAEQTAMLQGQELRLNSQEFNSVARMENARAKTLEAPLVALKTHQNVTPTTFPADVSALSNMSGVDAQDLLRVYRQPTGGNAEAKRNRFARFVGVRSIPLA